MEILAYTTSDWNNASNLGLVQVGDEVVLSTMSDMLPGVDSGMASSTIIPYMQFSRPSEAEAKCPLTGQNQSYCPVNEQTQLSLEESRPDSDNLLNRAIQHRVLLAYIGYKKSVMLIGDALVSFVNHMHSTVCQKHTCKCEQFFSLASHYDGCHNADCNICGLVWYSSVSNKLHAKFEGVKIGLLRDSH